MNALNTPMDESGRPLTGCRVIGLLNGTEVFGHEKGNIEVFKALRDAGAIVRVGVNASQNGGAVRELLDKLDFQTFLVPFGCQWSKTFFRKHPLLIFQCLWKVVRSSNLLYGEFRKFRPTHLHLGSPITYSYVAPAISMSRIPVVYRAGDEPPLDSKPNLMIWKSCMRRVSTIVANSEFVRTSILKANSRLSPKTSLIYNRAPQATADEHDQKHETADARRIVYVGQVSEHKGVALLVESAIKLVSLYPDIVFDIVGSSRFTHDFEQDVKSKVNLAGYNNRILFHGHVPNPDPYLQRAALHVAPSIFEEPAANVVLEAKRHGVPSVVFPSGGLPELVIDGINGHVCQEKTADSLMKGISLFLEDEKFRQKCAAEALRDLEIRFGDARFQSNWIRIYGNLIPRN